MMDEETAKTKWCPMVRFKGRDTGSGPAFNRYTGWQDNPYADMLCVGSSCMAWQAGSFKHQKNLADEDQAPNVGYCGAFGSQS